MTVTERENTNNRLAMQRRARHCQCKIKSQPYKQYIVGALTDRVIRNFSSNERSSAVRESVPLREKLRKGSDRERAVRRHECTARERGTSSRAVHECRR
jgi:hypothetical protein